MSKGSPCPYFQWGRWKKERDKLSLSFHNLPNAISSLLATEVVSSWICKILSCITFLTFAIFQGRKLILSSRNKVSGYSAMPVLSASYINHKKKNSLLPHISFYLFLSCWLNFSHCLLLFNEKLFTPEAIFSQQTASIVTIFHLFSFHPHLLQSICIDRWRWDSRALPGLWIQSWLSGHVIPARNWPGIIQAQPSPRSLHGCWKPFSEQHCSGGWKTSSDFLAMFISDHL